MDLIQSQPEAIVAKKEWKVPQLTIISKEDIKGGLNNSSDAHRSLS